MSTMFPPSPISGGILLSYKCNAACQHCIYACSPRWKNDWISVANLERTLTLLAGKIMPGPYGPKGVSFNHGLHFTGGEPFLKFDLLLKGVEIANQLGIPSLFVETNGFWCRQDEETKDKMRQLQEAGLLGILISVNPFILESVPFERTERATRIGTEIFGRNLLIYQMDYFMQFRRLGVTGRMPLPAYLRQVGLREATSRIELLPIGRAVYALTDWYDTYPARAFSGADCSAAFMRNYHNHWDNYGNVIPGFCAGLAIGNILENPTLYAEGITFEDYPLLKILFTQGVSGLYAFAQQSFGYQEQASGYVSACHLCVDIRQHIVKQTQAFRELRPGEFYERITCCKT
jgi:hypothetical protein